MPTSIEVWGGEEVGKRVVISTYDKRLVDEISLKWSVTAHLRARNSVLPE